MTAILDDITKTIGRTPLVRINRMAEGCVAEVIKKRKPSFRAIALAQALR
jgi:cysteine synthase